MLSVGGMIAKALILEKISMYDTHILIHVLHAEMYVTLDVLNLSTQTETFDCFHFQCDL